MCRRLPLQGRCTAISVCDHFLHPRRHMAPTWLSEGTGWQGTLSESQAELGGCCCGSRCCRHLLSCRLRGTLLLSDRLLTENCGLGLCDVVALLSLQVICNIRRQCS